MRILVHSYVPVYPYYDGAGLRVFHLTPYLTAQHTCDLIQERWPWESQASPLGPPGYPADWLEQQYRHVWNIQHRSDERLRYGWVWQSSELQRLIGEILDQGTYDAVWSGNDTLPIYLQANQHSHTPVLIAPTDSMHLHYWRNLRHTRTPKHWAWILAKWALYALYQVRVLNRMPYWTMVAERDADSIRLLSSHAQIRVIPYGIDSERFAHPDTERNPQGVVFLGTLGHSSTNERAIEWFLRGVWLRVVQVRPGASFRIVGRNPSQHIMDLARQCVNVTVTGYVKDPRPYLWKAGIAVLPMRSGAGIKNKLLEGWAAGCAVVSTRLGIEGVQQVQHGENVLIADKPAEMAELLTELMCNPSRQRELGASGRETVRQFYTWKAIARQLEAYLTEIADQSVG